MTFSDETINVSDYMFKIKVKKIIIDWCDDVDINSDELLKEFKL